MAVDGTWKLTVNTPMGAQESTLVIDTSGGAPSATQSAGSSEARPVDNVVVNGNEVSWQASITKPMAMTLEFSGIVAGDAMSGRVKLGMFGSQPFSGVRA
ncbi:MAG TPA: hypothetical protein VNH44_14850 [Micropepsaceae bacterium]|nr:hypothetical protein [Micropepsaceae bacterium]